jgi:peptide/nickel transport system ATP-binding protein
MKDGETVELAGSDEIYANPQHPYTRLLLSSMPGRISAA